MQGYLVLIELQPVILVRGCHLPRVREGEWWVKQELWVSSHILSSDLLAQILLLLCIIILNYNSERAALAWTDYCIFTLFILMKASLKTKHSAPSTTSSDH